ncbi:MAG: hypothetical protein GXP31_08420 [Kiritimatiellaeota bacterium]|nr:hypothetical protein [Kiritimatiellota bacterium]
MKRQLQLTWRVTALVTCSILFPTAARCASTVEVASRGRAAALAAQIRKTKLDSAVRKGSLRHYAAACLSEGVAAQGVGCLRDAVRQALPSKGRTALSERRLRSLGKASDALVLLLLAREKRLGPVPAPIADWLLGADDRLRLLVDTVSPDDNLGEVFRILGAIRLRDKDGADRFFRLALAIAVVWDQPRPPLHDQMGPVGPGKPASPVALFGYFRDLYSSNDARLAYARLSTPALVFVVDTPVPLSELKWARENVRGSASTWGRKFSEIRYDSRRLDAGQFSWPYGPYTLAAIRRRGGICADQAYYAVLTARAFGIPAMLFTGQGRRGGHGWLGFMKDAGKWEVDAGRYAVDKYATGYTVAPQTNLRMSDHDLALAYDRSLQTSRFDRAALLARLAAVCLDLERSDLALALAEQASESAPLYRAGWRVREQVLVHRDRPEELLELLDTEARVFRRFPDYMAGIRAAQAKLLRRLGRTDDAARVLRLAASRVKRKRDDLGRSLNVAQIQQAFENGDHAGALRKLERVLRDNRGEGEKVIPLVKLYLELTRTADRTHEAARFLKGYLTRMQNRYAKGWGQPVFLELLVRAYENDGDQRKAARLRKRIARD